MAKNSKINIDIKKTDLEKQKIEEESETTWNENGVKF